MFLRSWTSGAHITSRKGYRKQHIENGHCQKKLGQVIRSENLKQILISGVYILLRVWDPGDGATTSTKNQLSNRSLLC
jgi:hypothetical protein